MKPPFLILPVVMSLCACAQQNLAADAGPCDSTASKNHIVGSAALLGSGVGPYLLGNTRDIPGISRFDADKVSTNACANLRNDRNPRTFDLHKIGEGAENPDALITLNAGPSCPKARGGKV
jgi:hypothetical protein